ncbi:hypothetical protein ACFQ48_20920 [Hymenobacter caeli]|uniref:Uncharacterized protein n=1 Tax=Hymenobacter caeli TaxID=2735894 RepID=A0ABX2FWN3_9BACT|nr:hypothetical protein [Hymenobacter caeli]NRT21431.1 hypothetical protein [Hymenobacter caeli]
MNVDVEKVHTIEQVLGIHDEELWGQLRHMVDELVLRFDEKSAPAPMTEEAFSARTDASEQALQQGETVSHEEIVAHFRSRLQQWQG